MAKFCSNCGKEITENQDVCLGCGKVLNQQNKNINKNHSGYITATGVIMIILGVILILGSSDIYENPVLVFTIPGMVGLIAGIVKLNGKKDKNLLFISGILSFVAAAINFMGIIDVSLFSICAITFGIFDIIYSKK